MRLLLDTHTWIWAVWEPDQLARAVKSELENPRNEVFLSPISIWEAGHLARKRRFRLKGEFGPWLDRTLTRAPLREAPFNFAVATQAAAIELPQSDPGDVILAATAVVFDLTLVTADTQLLSCRWLETLRAV